MPLALLSPSDCGGSIPPSRECTTHLRADEELPASGGRETESGAPPRRLGEAVCDVGTAVPALLCLEAARLLVEGLISEASPPPPSTDTSIGFPLSLVALLLWERARVIRMAREGVSGR